MNEFQVIENIKRGDIKTFEQMFKEYYEMLCDYAYVFVKDFDLAEELVQEIFYQFWKKHETIQINSTLKGYMLQTVKNSCLQHIRHKNVENKYAEKIRAQVNQPAYLFTDEIIANELSEKIDKTLQSLPDKCREIFTLSRFEGLKYYEIAEKMSISVKTVEAYMGKALKSFRQNLGSYVGSISG
jgi:RNA polymerase sigma-70 factor, ECF subfamily